ALAVDVEQRVTRAGRGRGRGRDRAAHGRRVHLEPARLELGVLREAHGHRADERVALTGGVVRDVRGELVGERLGTPRLDLVVVGRRQLDRELVRDDGAVPADDGRALVDLAAQPAGELDGLEVAAE